MRRRPWLNHLQHQLLWWVGVVAVTLSLLALHQLSNNHTAADPTLQVAGQFNGHGDPNPARLAPLHHAHGVDQAHNDAATLGSMPSAPADRDCLECAQHHTMMLTCLAALTLLAVVVLLARPIRWPGLLPRRHARALPRDLQRRRRPRIFRLIELSISRT